MREEIRPAATHDISDSDRRKLFVTRVLMWVARIAGTAAIVPLMQIAFGEHGTGPASARGWICLALFPFGFSAGYLLAWRWPLLGGAISLACMVISLCLIGRIFSIGPYLIWAVLSIPAILFIIVGLRLRQHRAAA